MSNQLQLLQSQVDFPSTKVIRLPERIWVFGGQISDIGIPKPVSFRDKFVRHIHDTQPSFLSKVAKPEDFPEWWNFADYPDLLLFESDASCLSQLVVIFLESPGAWVELGALADDPDLCEKLLIVVPERYRTGQSFIELGPLRRIARLHPDGDSICVVQSDKHDDLDATELKVITSSIEARLRKTHKTESWDPNKRSHRLLLAADLADLYQAIRTATIAEIAAQFGFKTTLSELNMQARLLHMLKLANLKELGTEKILTTVGRNSHPLLNYQALPEKKFDRARFKLEAVDLIKKDDFLTKAIGAAK